MQMVSLEWLIFLIGATVAWLVEMERDKLCDLLKVFVQSENADAVMNGDSCNEDVHPREVQAFVPQFPGEGYGTIPILFRAFAVGKALEMRGEFSLFRFPGAPEHLETDW
jgi:hypothetical protein